MDTENNSVISTSALIDAGNNQEGSQQLDNNRTQLAPLSTMDTEYNRIMSSLDLISARYNQEGSQQLQINGTQNTPLSTSGEERIDNSLYNNPFLINSNPRVQRYTLFGIENLTERQYSLGEKGAQIGRVISLLIGFSGVMALTTLCHLPLLATIGITVAIVLISSIIGLYIGAHIGVAYGTEPHDHTPSPSYN